nr:MAG TPA: hypothetical protein [Caudoviricetes sp.]
MTNLKQCVKIPELDSFDLEKKVSEMTNEEIYKRNLAIDAYLEKMGDPFKLTPEQKKIYVYLSLLTKCIF